MIKLMGLFGLILSFSVHASDLGSWVKELKLVFSEFEKNYPEELSLSDQRSIVFNFEIISKAFALGDEDCLYAGWPVKKLKWIIASFVVPLF